MRRNLLTVIALNILGLILFFSWYLPENHGFWFLFDKNIFYFFIERLILDGFFTYLVALTNNRKFDLVAIAAMLSLMGYFFIKGDRKIKREVILIGLTMIVVAVLLNQIGRQIPVMRGSPTGYFENVNRVSELVTTISAKDYSGDSFPGDHGLMLMIFTAFMWRYFGF